MKKRQAIHFMLDNPDRTVTTLGCNPWRFFAGMFQCCEETVWTTRNPMIHMSEELDYLVVPVPLQVKKWRWAISRFGEDIITSGHVTEADVARLSNGNLFIKLPWTQIEVEE